MALRKTNKTHPSECERCESTKNHGPEKIRSFFKNPPPKPLKKNMEHQLRRLHRRVTSSISSISLCVLQTSQALTGESRLNVLSRRWSFDPSDSKDAPLGTQSIEHSRKRTHKKHWYTYIVQGFMMFYVCESGVKYDSRIGCINIYIYCIPADFIVSVTSDWWRIYGYAMICLVNHRMLRKWCANGSLV